MKKKLIAAAGIVACLSLASYGSLAYFTAEETAHNVITSGTVDIDLQEWADEAKTTPFPTTGIENVMPGTQVTKIVEVKNVGTGDAYIRVKVDERITLANGTAGATTPMSLDINTTNWTLKDGYYYYNKAVTANEVTAPLFNKVTFNTNMNNDYQKCEAKIDVKAEAVQVANNGTSALDAQGWATAQAAQ